MNTKGVFVLVAALLLSGSEAQETPMPEMTAEPGTPEPEGTAGPPMPGTPWPEHTPPDANYSITDMPETVRTTTASPISPGCSYTYCGVGQCKRAYGFEWCNCTGTGYGGLLCEIPPTCDTCLNAASCYISADGLRVCLCMPGYSGIECDIPDATAQCSNTSSDDMMFLPVCSLKTFLAGFAQCINSQLPYLDMNREVCTEKITKTKHCIYQLLSKCSNSLCKSIYWYGGEQLLEDIAEPFYDPTSNFSRELDEILCALPENGTFSYPDEPYNIGKPVCGMDLMDRFVRAMVDFGNSYQQHDICMSLKMLKWQIYNITKDSCDWANITQALPMLSRWDDPQYGQKLMEMAHEFFLEWFVPGCEPTVDVCDGYCMNGGYCSATFGVPYCACPPGIGGSRCEKPDPTNFCPSPGQNDVILLPLCTLRNTTEQLVECGMNMFHVAFGQQDYQSCLFGMYQTINCIGNMIGNCSRSTCPSIYHLPGVTQAMDALVAGMYNHTIVTGIAQFVCQPIPQGGFLQFLGDLPLDMEIPVCPSVTLGDIINILRDVENGLLSGQGMGLAEMCRVLSQARNRALQLTNRCNMSLFYAMIPQDYSSLVPYLERGFNAVRSMLSNFTLPMCQGVEEPTGMCPMVTAATSQCEMADAWMCQHFQYKKMMSSWMEEYMVWWRGCSGFAQRDWNHWASSMGLKTGSMYNMGMGSGYGEYGFTEMVKANLQCTGYSSMDCYMGESFYDTLGCRHCYHRGLTERNSRSLFMMWMQEYEQHMILIKMYNALRQECSGSYSGCGDATSPTPPTFPGYDTTTHY